MTQPLLQLLLCPLDSHGVDVENAHRQVHCLYSAPKASPGHNTDAPCLPALKKTLEVQFMLSFSGCFHASTLPSKSTRSSPSTSNMKEKRKKAKATKQHEEKLRAEGHMISVQSNSQFTPSKVYSRPIRCSDIQCSLELKEIFMFSLEMESCEQLTPTHSLDRTF